MPIRKELRPLYRTPQYLAVRIVARESAQDRCEICGELNNTAVLRTRAIPGLGGLEEGVKIVVIQCGAAHLNGIAGDDRPENIAWLCRGDHLRHDIPVHVVHAHETRGARKDLERPLLVEPLLVEAAA